MHYQLLTQPNLLKLLALRPPLPYFRLVDKDTTSKNIGVVGPILAQLREVKTTSLFSTAADSDAISEGEEPTYTHAEEIKRQIRREGWKILKTEQFKIAKETCTFIQLTRFTFSLLPISTDKPEAVSDPFLYPVSVQTKNALFCNS